jgi:DNA-binding HxlR family transcriptional regulator
MPVGDERFLRSLYDLKYLFGDKWAPAIVVALASGPMRRKEILSTISSYSIGEEWSDRHAVLHDSILARTLKKMTEEGILSRRRDTETFPARVYYSLNPEVVELLDVLDTVVAWVNKHPGLIAQAQAYRRHNNDNPAPPAGPHPSDDDEEH